MIRRRAGQAILALVALALLAAAAGAAILTLGPLDPIRAALAERLLVDLAGDPMQVDGPVEVDLGRTARLSVGGIRRIEDDAPAPGPAHGLRASFDLGRALRGDLRPSYLALSGFRIVSDGAAAAPDHNAAPAGEAAAAQVERFLASPLARGLEIDDLVFRRLHDPDGWDYALSFDRLVSRAAPDQRIGLEASGRINGVAFAAAASAPQPGAADRAFDLSLSMPGLSVKLAGELAEGADGPRLDAVLTATSASLAALLEALDLSARLDGEATLTARLVGLLARPAARDLTLEATSAFGDALRIVGSVEDAWAGAGLSLDVALTFAEETRGDRPLAPRSISAHAAGDATGVEVAELEVETGLASLDLHRIGPVSIARVARGPTGVLRLDGIRIRQGDPARPAIDLEGDLADALDLQGLALAGRFDLDFATLAGLPEGAAMGRLQGELSISDASGDLRIERIDARTSEGAPLSLAVSKTEEAPEPTLSLRIADAGALAAAIGRDAGAAKGVAIAFDGTGGFEGEDADLAGRLRIGDTVLEGRLSAGLDRPGFGLSGDVSTDLLRPSSVAQAIAAARLFSGAEPRGVSVHPSAVVAARGTLTVSAGAIGEEAAHPIAKDLRAELALSHRRVEASKIAMTVFGAPLQGSATARLDRSPPDLTAKASLDGVPVEKIFATFGRPAPASGPLDLEAEVSGPAGGVAAFLGAMTGTASLSLVEGRLADDTINLAGESLISWIVSRGHPGGAPLTCFVAAFDFASGVGKSRRLVLETDQVRFDGAGTLDLHARRMAFLLDPTPKRSGLVGRIGTVSVEGPLAKPKVELASGAVAGKVIGDAVGLPFRLLGDVLGAGGKAPASAPCAPAPAPRK